jgi:hypothetical protein
MNKLRESFYKEVKFMERAEKCEQITDDFSVKFAEWSSLYYAYFVNGIFYRNTYDLENGDGLTTTELLNYFKENVYGKEI